MGTAYVDNIKEHSSGHGVHIPGHIIQIQKSIVTGNVQATGSTYIDVGIILHGQKQKDGTIVSVDIFRAIGVGVPFNFSEKAFDESEIPWGAQYDKTRNGVYQYKRVKNA